MNYVKLIWKNQVWYYVCVRNVEKTDMTCLCYDIYKMRSLMGCDYDMTIFEAVQKAGEFIIMLTCL